MKRYRRLLWFFGILGALGIAAAVTPKGQTSAPSCNEECRSLIEMTEITSTPAPPKCVLSEATDKCSQHVVMVLWHSTNCGHSGISPAALTFAQDYAMRHQIFNQMTGNASAMGRVVDNLFAAGERDPLGLICRQEAPYIGSLLQ